MIQTRYTQILNMPGPKGFEDVIVPPTFPMTAFFYMKADNVFLENMEKWGMDPGKSVHGEVEFVFERPVCAGEAFEGVAGTRNVYEKPGETRRHDDLHRAGDKIDGHIGQACGYRA